MHRPSLSSRPLLCFFLSFAVPLLLALPSLLAAQKTALHLDSTPADPFLAASGKPVVLIFVRTDCPISNRYAPVIQRISSEYGAKIALWLVYPSKASTAEKIHSSLKLKSRLPRKRLSSTPITACSITAESMICTRISGALGPPPPLTNSTMPSRPLSAGKHRHRIRPAWDVTSRTPNDLFRPNDRCLLARI